MRIVIDLQGAQGASRERGIGRYSLALAQAMVRNRGDHEVIVALNGMFPESIKSIRDAFDGILAQENIRVWHANGPVNPLNSDNTWRRQTAELMREAFLSSLRPDILHVTSLFEGFGDDAVHSISSNPFTFPTAVTVYDLIPLVQSDYYLKPNPTYDTFYREKLEHLKRANLYLAISTSSRQEVIDHLGVSGQDVVNISAAADSIFRPECVPEIQSRTLLKRFGLARPFIMYSGATDERKNHLRLIKAFSILPTSIRKNHQLAIVGYLPIQNREKFEKYAALCGLDHSELVITGRITDREMVRLYNLCTLFVFPSWHEGFGLPALEAMSCGAPVIASNTSSLPEVIGRGDALFDPFDEISIAEKITEVLSDKNLLEDLRKHGLTQASNFSWDESARRTLTALETCHLMQHQTTHLSLDELGIANPSAVLVDKIAKLGNPPANEIEWINAAQSISQNYPNSVEKQLLIDISELSQRDSKTGIQRVVRSVLVELLSNPPSGFRVEPVYAVHDEPGYRYARTFTKSFLNLQGHPALDEPVDISNGDVFLGLDLQHHIVLQQQDFYSYLRRIGVKVHFVVYDLLPVLLPNLFPEGTTSLHSRWLEVLAQGDGLVCISRAVADEMLEWLSMSSRTRTRPLKLGWFHLGADVSGSSPSMGIPSNADEVLESLIKRPTFLSVGTIEPRKGQMQTLAAFQQLWDEGVDVNLVIVGKHGWNVDLLVEMLRIHSERNKRLFWLEGVTDEYLEKVYAMSTCLIAASEGEGFGLPLIEAAQHKKFIIARDIAVFREVAGKHALYFSGLEPEALAEALKEWLKLEKSDQAPQSTEMPWLTWRQSTQTLLDIILGNHWYKQWLPDNVKRFCGSDARMLTAIGKSNGTSMQTTNRAGYLLFGPYIALEAGSYSVSVRGAFGKYTSGARIDMVANNATLTLGEAALKETNQGDCLAEVAILIDMPCNDFEVRVWVTESTDLKISMISISPLITDQNFAEMITESIEPTEKDLNSAKALSVAGLAVDDPTTAQDQHTPTKTQSVISIFQTHLSPSQNTRNQVKGRRNKRR